MAGASLAVSTISSPAFAQQEELDADAAMALLAGDDEGDDAMGRVSSFELSIAVGVLSRRFDYEEDHFSSLYAYELDAAPLAVVDMDWFPGSYVSRGPLSWAGIGAHFEQGLGVQSELANESLATHTSALRVGAVGRLPLSKDCLLAADCATPPSLIKPRIEYGSHRFSIEPLSDRGTVVPPVDYSFVRIAVDVEVRIEKALFGFGVGHRFVQRAPSIDDDEWWPEARVGGTDATVFVGIAATAGVDVKLGLDLRRYHFDLRPSTDDSRALGNQVAGGAVDQYASGWIGVAWHPLWHGGKR